MVVVSVAKVGEGDGCDDALGSVGGLHGDLVECPFLLSGLRTIFKRRPKRPEPPEERRPPGKSFRRFV